MKTNFFITLICICFLATNSTFAQTSTIFKFKIWKNSESPENYLGEHTATLSGSGTSAYRSTTTPTSLTDPTPSYNGITDLLNPGDVLIIKNLCSQGTSQIDFDGISRKATIGFTSRSSCSIPLSSGGPANPNPLKHIADVCQIASGPLAGSACASTVASHHFTSWNFNNTISITLPDHASEDTYLMISCGIMNSPVTNCGCGGHASFTKINLNSSTTPPVLVSYHANDEVAVLPNTGSNGGILTVFNKATARPVQTAPYRNGIKFTYAYDIEYEVVLRDQGFVHRHTLKVPKGCTNNNRNDASNNNTTLNFEPTSLSTFPNPTTGIVNIQLKNPETTETNIQVLNTLGQVVLEKQVQNDHYIEVDLSKQISGIYMLHVVNGNTEFTEKVIKE